MFVYDFSLNVMFCECLFMLKNYFMLEPLEYNSF